MSSSYRQLSARQPRYMIVAQALMHDIETGRHAVGTLLPTEAELGQHFNVSRHTIREAIRRLTDLGMVSAQAGVGTTVRAQKPVSHYALTAEGLSDLFQYVNDVMLRVSSHGDVIADADLAKLLNCPVGQKWFQMSGDRYVVGQDQSIGLATIYVAASYRAAVEEISEPGEPIYALIERRFGLQVRDVRQEISAVALNGTEAGRLGVRSGSPGLQVIRKYYANSGELIEVAVNLHPADRFSYASTLRLRSAGEQEH